MGKQKSSCWWCVKAAKCIPVVFILTIVAWSYYAYVIQLCYYTIESFVQKIFYIFFYHVTFVMFLWSYWKTVFTNLAEVPPKFRIPAVDVEKLQQAENEEAMRQILERLAQDLPITNLTVKGTIRFCEKCLLIKPDRAHHCNFCGTCVLKMDHHCPWVNNCVGFHNYKYFMLFLAYSLLYCTFIALTSLQYFIMFWKNQLQGTGRFHLLFLFFVALMFAISLNSLFFYHCYLILHNRSTLEAFRPPMFRTGKDKNGFSLGKYNNFQEVFGDNKRLWFIPVFTSLGNGVMFPVRSQHQSVGNSYNSMGSTHNSFGDGVHFPMRQDEDTQALLAECEDQMWHNEPDYDSPRQNRSGANLMGSKTNDDLRMPSAAVVSPASEVNEPLVDQQPNVNVETV